MPFYTQRGQIPHKRHTQFRKPDGGLYREQLMGTKGFSGVESLLYHINPPTQVRRVELHSVLHVDAPDQGPLRHRHFMTAATQPGGDVVTGRRILLFNDDVAMGIIRPTDSMPYFYRNGEGDEVLFIHKGSGVLETIFGKIPYGPGDYLVIPIGTTYRLAPGPDEQVIFLIESSGPIETPRRYRNEFGQLNEHSPYCERDFRPPSELVTHDEAGEFEVRVRTRGKLTSFCFDFHPFDVIGWDGYLFPYAFNIADFEPITGRVHQPPPVHQTFAGPNFVICSFVPRLFDYHPLAIPAPYYHSNVDSDEVLYYVDGNFMSRKGIEVGSITLHPSGLPHGPHPGTVEASIGARETHELAVMLDTFRPLKVTRLAEAHEDTGYIYSWQPASK